MRYKPFTRPTIIAANEFIAAEVRSHMQINKIVLRLGLEADVTEDNSLGIEKKLDRLGRLILARAEEVVATVDGSATLAEAFVREAVVFASQGSQDHRQLALERGLARDGFVIVWSEWGRVPSLRSALPDEVDLPASDDEVRTLLGHFQFTVPSSHLEQAIEAHTRGDWAAANAHFEPFSKPCSTTSRGTSTRIGQGRCPHRKIAAPCWQTRASVSLRRTEASGRLTEKTTSTAFSRCCTPTVPTRACRTRITAPSVICGTTRQARAFSDV